MKTKKQKQTLVIISLILLLAIPIHAEEATKPEDLIQTVEIVKGECQQAPGVTLCQTSLGAGAGCSSSAGTFTADLLKFNLDEIPKEGNIKVRGGENINCRINGREIISINVWKDCNGEKINTISRQDFQKGENKIECSVYNNRHHNHHNRRKSGLTLSYFSYTTDNSHLIGEEQNTMLKTEAYQILEESSTSDWKKAKYAKKNVKYKEKLEKIKQKIKDKKKK